MQLNEIQVKVIALFRERSIPYVSRGQAYNMFLYRSREQHRFHSIIFLENHDKYLIKFYSLWTVPKLDAAICMSKHTPIGWS
jgi:hypothetical protein